MLTKKDGNEKMSDPMHVPEPRWMTVGDDPDDTVPEHVQRAAANALSDMEGAVDYFDQRKLGLEDVADDEFRDVTKALERLMSKLEDLKNGEW